MRMFQNKSILIYAGHNIESHVDATVGLCIDSNIPIIKIAKIVNRPRKYAIKGFIYFISKLKQICKLSGVLKYRPNHFLEC